MVNSCQVLGVKCYVTPDTYHVTQRKNMPCSDSSSSMVIQLDPQERFKRFEYAKITCGREITAKTGLSEYFEGRTLEEIVHLPFPKIVGDLAVKDEEGQFILYLEWDALRAAAALYLGIEDDQIDTGRCFITSIDHAEQGITIAEVILPPKEMPKILPCSLGEARSS